MTETVKNPTIIKLIDGNVTLRDYFAAHVLNGHISNPFDDDGDLADIAEWAYEFADAMLKEREQGQ